VLTLSSGWNTDYDGRARVYTDKTVAGRPAGRRPAE
jgi:hypothetical protein